MNVISDKTGLLTGCVACQKVPVTACDAGKLETENRTAHRLGCLPKVPVTATLPVMVVDVRVTGTVFVTST